MRKLVSITLLLALLSYGYLFAQNYTDTLYTIQTVDDVVYGMAIDAAGNNRELKMDISTPTNDTPPACGRPLFVVVHGGAFIAGDKKEGSIPRFRKDFAKRGYTTASIQYRLGQIPTDRNIHCNISGLGAEWDCLNMADTSEWYRAYYRSIQDVNGAIRYLVNHAQDYDIDPNNIFLVGESAGAFIAMGAAYLNDPSEVLQSLVGVMPDAPTPNSIYDGQCVQKYGLDTTIASMNLARPDLGPYQGTLNSPAVTNYRIRAVGNFFGGVMNNIFLNGDTTLPALYIFHQPNDLVVPNRKQRVFAGYAYCATQFPFNCQYIINRPQVIGGQGLVDLFDEMTLNGDIVPDLQVEITNNNVNCVGQLADPSKGGHQIDNYSLRSKNLAEFFAQKIANCRPTAIDDKFENAYPLTVFPNPLSGGDQLHIKFSFQRGDHVMIRDILGREISSKRVESPMEEVVMELENEGVYIISIQHQGGISSAKFVSSH